MEPELVVTFTAEDDSGGREVVQVWMTYHTIPGTMHDRRRGVVPDAFATLTTDRGEEIAATDESGRLWVVGTGRTLTANEGESQAMAKFSEMRRQRMREGRRLPG